MTFEAARKCPACRSDSDTKFLRTDGRTITFRCRHCEREYSVQLGHDQRPVFTPQVLSPEAA